MLFSFDLAVHDTGQNEGVRVNGQIIQQSIGIRHLGELDQMLWGTEKRLSKLNESIADHFLVHFFIGFK
jgi:hypothetical protein